MLLAKIKPLALLALAAALLFGFAKIKTLSAENADLSRRLGEAQALSHSLSLEVAMNRAALSAREAEVKRLAEESAAARQTFDEVYKNDHNAKEWADAVCPDALLECLLP